MAQEIRGEIIKQVEGAGWLVPTPHEPFAEGGGAYVYLCYKRDLMASLESFVGSTVQAGVRPEVSTELGCKALGALHDALMVDKAGRRCLESAETGEGKSSAKPSRNRGNAEALDVRPRELARRRR